MILFGVVLFVGIAATAAQTDQSELPNCPPELHRNQYLRQNGSSCYEFIVNHHGSWYVADRDCKRRKGHLVTIDSSTEQAFIFDSLTAIHFQHDRGVWIGLTDHENEGTWKWVTGQRLLHDSYTYWAKGQPGVFGGLEDCALLEFRNGGHWHDYACEGVLFNLQNHAWVCEYAVVTTNSTTTNTSAPTNAPSASTMTPTNTSLPPNSPANSVVTSAKTSAPITSSVNTAMTSTTVQPAFVTITIGGKSSVTPKTTTTPISTSASTATNQPTTTITVGTTTTTAPYTTTVTQATSVPAGK